MKRVVIALMTMTTVAHADTVVTRSGEVIHGKIIELEPGEVVQIDERMIPWSDVASADRDDETKTRVTIRAVSRVTLFRMDQGHIDEVCTSPCNQEVPRAGLYWVAGRGIRSSNRIQLAQASAMTLAVTGGSRDLVSWGIGLTVAGVVTIVIPGALAITLLASAAGTPRTPEMATYWVAAIAINGIGLGLAITGLILWRTNSSSTIVRTAKWMTSGGTF